MRSRTYINLTSFTKILIVSLLLLGFVTNQIKEYDLKEEYPEAVCTVLLEERSTRCGSPGIRECLKCKTCTRGKPKEDWIDNEELERIFKESAEEKKYWYLMCDGSKNSTLIHLNWMMATLITALMMLSY